MSSQEDFNKAAADRFDKLRMATPELRARAALIEEERHARHDTLKQDQTRRRPEELNEERHKAALERPGMKLVPTWAQTGRSKAGIEKQAMQAVDARHRQEAAAIDKAMDRRLEALIKQPERPDRTAEPGPEAAREQTALAIHGTASEITQAVEWTPEQTALFEQIKAQHEAERGNRGDDTDRGI